MVKHLAALETEEEGQLIEDTETIGAQLIDDEISQTVAETLMEYQHQVATANAIEDRLCEMAGEMVEQDSSSLLQLIIDEAIQQVGFEEALPLVSDEFLETLLAMDV